MQMPRSPWLPLLLSLGVHALFALCFLGLSVDVDVTRDPTTGLDSCILLDEAVGSAAESGPASSQPASQTNQAMHPPLAESEGEFSAVVTDLPPRGSAEE